MFSKPLELIGFALISIGIGKYLGAGAAMIFGGGAIVFVGSVTDDKSVGMALRRGTGWARYVWHRQLAKENGITLPNLRWGNVPTGWVVCECGRDEDCPLCDGTGYIPDPEYRENSRSPHPPVRVNPQTEVMANGLARQRQERAKIHDRTPALSRNGS